MQFLSNEVTCNAILLIQAFRHLLIELLLIVKLVIIKGKMKKSYEHKIIKRLKATFSIKV